MALGRDRGVVIPGQLCARGGRFRNRCEQPAINACQYCGRAFCAAHCYVVRDHEAVCVNTTCRRKFDDLQEHLRYRERVSERNRAGLCGHEGCGPHPRTQCSLCQGRFCEDHLRDRLYPFREGRVVVDRPASVCPHCWERRKIWRRT